MKQNSEQKVEDMNVSPTCGKPIVVGSTVILGDCLEGMKHYPDKYFDLAVVDPPYGIGEADGRQRTRKKHNNVVKHTKKQWDLTIPEMEYFTELYRVSKNQIVWGANYFTQFLPASMGWIFWDKKIGGDFSDGEFAFTSFNKAAKLFSVWCETGGGAPQRIHPTQKPVRLYNKCFEYAKLEAGAKVLDTHLGSGSSRISADKNGFDFTGFEIDKEYYDLSEKRFNNYKSQLRIEGW